MKKLYNKPLFLALCILLFVSCAYSLKGITIISKNEAVEKNKEQLKSTIEFQNLLRLISQSLKPTVVNIQVTLKPRPQSGFATGDAVMDEFFRRFFGQLPNERQKEQDGGNASGSGFIISQDGYIVTNAHVVRNSKSINVTLEDQTSHKAELIGLDTKTDIALIKIKPTGKLDAAPLGDSDSIEPGDFALAIGNPFGLSGSLTFGIISAKGRNNFIEENAVYKNYIQTDVPINPGNSGGPLINIYGQVVGLNSAIYSTSGGSIGIGFAIPINIVKNVINQLVQYGHVTRGSIGVLLGSITQDIVKAYGLKNKQGALINEVFSNSPAEKAGLQIWDVVTTIDGKPVKDSADLVGKISSLAPGQEIKLGILRNGKPANINITLGSNKNSDSNERNSESTDNSTDSSTEATWHGMKLITIQTAKNNGFNIPDLKEGLIIVDINPDSKIASNGVRPGDILVSINKKGVNSLKEVKAISTKKTSYVQIRSSQSKQNILVVLP